jgi:hypothetical protein
MLSHVGPRSTRRTGHDHRHNRVPTLKAADHIEGGLILAHHSTLMRSSRAACATGFTPVDGQRDRRDISAIYIERLASERLVEVVECTNQTGRRLDPLAFRLVRQPTRFWFTRTIRRTLRVSGGSDSMEMKTRQV